MADIIIKEYDESLYRTRVVSNDNIVLVIGEMGDSTTTNAHKFKLLRSINELNTYVGTQASPTDRFKLSYTYASHILLAGFPVLFYGLTNSDSSGTELSTVFTADNINILKDKINCKVKYIPTIYKMDATTINSIINTLMDDSVNNGEDNRGDGLVIVDGTYEKGTTNPVTTYCSADPTDTAGYLYNVINSANLVNSSFMAIPGPASRFKSTITGYEIMMPPSFFVLKTMAEGYSRGLPAWSIFAGADKGVINGAEGFNSVISYQTMKDWTDVKSLIPLMNIPPYGNLIFGNSTRLHPGTTQVPTTRSALDSLNVRLICNEIKRAIFDICLGLMWSTNDAVLWNDFKSKLDPILSDMKSNRGLYDYRIILDDTTVTSDAINRLEVPGKVLVNPMRPAEKFYIDFTLTSAGARF